MDYSFYYNVNENEKFRVVVYYELNLWIVQGLEYDLCSQGKTLSEAFDRFEKLVNIEIIGDENYKMKLENVSDKFESRWKL